MTQYIALIETNKREAELNIEFLKHIIDGTLRQYNLDSHIVEVKELKETKIKKKVVKNDSRTPVDNQGN